ncbi:small peptidoglycan-associated lipoprotein [Fredinandcohnia sp. 179-A 10B2 NHS]|uniref:small peptidoglycan-associated lipoprotein n=1 Tax=Fredinandcohnia sp. 179-A 10B2 NHS TaxID=3235176 RepID=UPI00399EEB2B
MKAYLLFVLSFFLLSSCSPKEPIQPTIMETDEKQLIFFSDEENIRNESNYYDALLELRSKYPTEIANMKIISYNDSRLYTNYEIDEYPSLLIVHQNKVIKKIEGIVEKDEIIVPIDDALSSAK